MESDTIMEEPKGNDQETNGETEQEQQDGAEGSMVEEASVSGIPFIQFMERDNRGIMLVGVW